MPEPRHPNDDMVSRGPPRRRRTALWIWLLLLLAAAAAARWYVWPKLQAWWNDDAAAAIEPANAVAPPDATQVRLDALQQLVERQRGTTESVLSGLRGSVAQLQQQVSAGNTGEARLAEVEHLVQMARVHAELEVAPRTALRLLGAADALMADSGDPRYLGVRTALAADVAKLQAQAAIEVEGTYVRISQLARSVPQLPLQQPVYRPEASTTAPASNDAWSNMLESLRGLVRVRMDRTAAELPVLTLEGQALVRERIALALEQAGDAVLRGQPTVYREALARADALVRQHARAEHAATRAFRQSLASLVATPMQRSPVAITALIAVQQIPRMQPPGLLPPPEAFGALPAPPLEGVAQTVTVAPAAPAAAPASPSTAQVPRAAAPPSPVPTASGAPR